MSSRKKKYPAKWPKAQRMVKIVVVEDADSDEPTTSTYYLTVAEAKALKRQLDEALA